MIHKVRIAKIQALHHLVKMLNEPMEEPEMDSHDSLHAPEPSHVLQEKKMHEKPENHLIEGSSQEEASESPSMEMKEDDEEEGSPLHKLLHQKMRSTKKGY